MDYSDYLLDLGMIDKLYVLEPHPHILVNEIYHKVFSLLG